MSGQKEYWRRCPHLSLPLGADQLQGDAVPLTLQAMDQPQRVLPTARHGGRI